MGDGIVILKIELDEFDRSGQVTRLKIFKCFSASLRRSGSKQDMVGAFGK